MLVNIHLKFLIYLLLGIKCKKSKNSGLDSQPDTGWSHLREGHLNWEDASMGAGLGKPIAHFLKFLKLVTDWG